MAGEWFSLSMLWLGVQAVAAIVSIRAFRFGVAPNITRLHEPRGAIDSLGPFAIALPLITAGWRVDWNMGTAGAAGAGGWIAIGAPIVVAILAFGCALCVPAARAAVAARLSVTPLAAAGWSAVGALLLLLGAAGDLTIWTGQSAFAAGAIALWINTPELTRDEPAGPDRAAGAALTLVLFCGIAQALAIGFAPARWLPIAGGVALAHAAIIVALAARLAAPHAAVRLGGWTATYGVLLGLGVISLRHLLPQMFLTVRGEPGRPPLKVAHGFGHFALEATIMLLLGAAALVFDRIQPRPLRIALGAALILAAARLAVWRLASW